MGINVCKLSCREFFSGHFKIKNFFCTSKIFEKELIFRSIFRDFTGSPESSSSEAGLSVKRLIFWPVKIKHFSVSFFFALGSATDI
jgi:hypothetical protein